MELRGRLPGEVLPTQTLMLLWRCCSISLSNVLRRGHVVLASLVPPFLYIQERLYYEMILRKFKRRKSFKLSFVCLFETCSRTCYCRCWWGPPCYPPPGTWGDGWAAPRTAPELHTLSLGPSSRSRGSAGPWSDPRLTRSGSPRYRYTPGNRMVRLLFIRIILFVECGRRAHVGLRIRLYYLFLISHLVLFGVIKIWMHNNDSYHPRDFCFAELLLDFSFLSCRRLRLLLKFHGTTRGLLSRLRGLLKWGFSEIETKNTKAKLALSTIGKNS